METFGAASLFVLIVLFFIMVLMSFDTSLTAASSRSLCEAEILGKDKCVMMYIPETKENNDDK